MIALAARQNQAPALRRLLEILVGLLPLFAVAYLYVFQDAALLFDSREFHALVIVLALLEGVFIAYVSWRCYVKTGEIFVKCLTLGFIGFTVVYALYGAFTPLVGRDMSLFLLYGPVARLLICACLLAAVLQSGGSPDAPERRKNAAYWMFWFGIFFAINVGVAALAQSPWAALPWLRWGTESGSAALCMVTLVLVHRRGIRSPLMLNFCLALAWFVISAFAFMLAQAWNHMWWLAQGIFVGGFSILGYGTLKSYRMTQSFERVFSESELFEDLAQTNIRLKDTLERLKSSNRQLEAQVRTLEVARSQFAALFAISPDGIIVVEEGGLILKANPRAEQMLGYAPGAMTGLAVEELMPRESRERHVRHRRLHEYSQLTRPMGALERPLACLRQDGSTFPAAISISGLVFDGRQCMVTFIRDLSRQVAEMAKLQELDRSAMEQAKFLESVVALLPGLEFKFRRSPGGLYALPFVGKKSREILGLAADKLVLEGTRLLFSQVHPTDLGPLITSIEQAVAERAPWQATWRTYVADQGESICHVCTSSPVVEADGSLLWSAYLRVAGAQGAAARQTLLRT